MAIAEEQVQAALKELVDPNTGKDYIAGKAAKNIKIDGDSVSLDIVLGYPGRTQVVDYLERYAARLKTQPRLNVLAVVARQNRRPMASCVASWCGQAGQAATSGEPTPGGSPAIRGVC